MPHKKAIVTGAAGFIGSHLTELLLREGYEIIAFVHYNSRNSWGWLDRIEGAKDIQVVTGDIRDYDSVFAAAKGCSHVFHLAALIGIPYSYISPQAYIRTNIEGTYNVLQAARMHETENIIITSTSEVYGTAQYVPIDENHPLLGQSPYSATKIGADQLALSFHLSFGLPVRIVRPFNTYGPRQSARAVIPTVISQIADGAKVIRLGNLTPKRDLTFVKDTVRAFWAIATCDKFIGEVTNIGMNQEISIGELAQEIIQLMQSDAVIESEGARIRPTRSEVERLCCNNEKLLRNTSWKPTYSLRQGLTETIQWLQNHMNDYRPGIYNV